MTHTTPDGREWHLLRIKGVQYAELINVPPMCRLLTTDLRGFVPPVEPR